MEVQVISRFSLTKQKLQAVEIKSKYQRLKIGKKDKKK